MFAGVYNEYIIKGAGADIHIMIQNVFMYLDSILCNIALLSVKVNIDWWRHDETPGDNYLGGHSKCLDSILFTIDKPALGSASDH